MPNDDRWSIYVGRWRTLCTATIYINMPSETAAVGFSDEPAKCRRQGKISAVELRRLRQRETNDQSVSFSHGSREPGRRRRSRDFQASRGTDICFRERAIDAHWLSRYDIDDITDTELYRHNRHYMSEAR